MRNQLAPKNHDEAIQELLLIARMSLELIADDAIPPVNWRLPDSRPMTRSKVHLHLVSDATGETNNAVVRSCLAEFEGIEVVEHSWTLVRKHDQVEKVLAAVKAHPGLVLFTVGDQTLRSALQSGCRSLQVPCIPVLDPIIAALANFLPLQTRGQPGRRHEIRAWNRSGRSLY